jgi:sodium-dependent dicarboxylate transporter 2/3/5
MYREATGAELSFLDWMRLGIPVVVVFIPIAWLWLTRGHGASPPLVLPVTGQWRPAERRVLTVFALTALAWVTRTEPWGGWSAWLGAESAGDSTVALAAVALLFIIPDGERGRLLDWETANRIPWGLLILFGGGIAIARAFEESGLSLALGRTLSTLADLPTIAMIATLSVCVTFLTEVTSNTATATLLMPVLAAAAHAAKVDPALLMAPAALSASCAFMLPVATAPNAIVFGTGKISTREMAREGLVLNLIGAVIITVASVLIL